MGKGVARANIDYASKHRKKDNKHNTSIHGKYISTDGFVTIDGHPIIVVGDKTKCGEKVVEGSSLVTINGKGIHRLGDKLDRHRGRYSPSICAKACDWFVVD